MLPIRLAVCRTKGEVWSVYMADFSYYYNIAGLNILEHRTSPTARPLMSMALCPPFVAGRVWNLRIVQHSMAVKLQITDNRLPITSYRPHLMDNLAGPHHPQRSNCCTLGHLHIGFSHLTLTNWLESCGGCCTARKLCSYLSQTLGHAKDQ